MRDMTLKNSNDLITWNTNKSSVCPVVHLIRQEKWLFQISLEQRVEVT